ncbi:MAG: aminoacyl-tRNA hydrolase [Rhodobacteraceae bacterium CG17_big_fil_post_rev_8_21_14_2_50_63_15]|nr:aminoacyl-tRNA hydrolase [Roseovarius sp.]PIV77722.1 MAG: aminoacyl-tRNA hydrolase [Rhodobacteraceae bacterium CG17_big_fil_post_rev_8_21_14_2_50_63_15]
MQLFVGLGNPGAKYARNRHNVGFMAVDEIHRAHGFGPWRARFQGEVSEGILGGEKVILLKPATFMNLSGQSVGEAMRFYKIDPAAVTVFHDELDLAPAKLRVKQGGGHAGHNGLRSIHAHIGETYQRVRLGIGHPGHKDRVAQYVLQDFAKTDESWLADLLHGIADGAPWLAQGKADRFLTKVASHVSPPRSSTTSGSGAAPPSEVKADPSNTPSDSRNPLQKLVDRFR